MSEATLLTRRNFFLTSAVGASMTLATLGCTESRPAAFQVNSASTEDVVTVLFSVTVREDRATEFHDVAARLTATTREQDEGCLAYVFLQQQGEPREYVLYEQWRDQSALDAHLVRLQEMLGPPPPGGRLPKTFLDLCEKTRAVRYRPLA
jgi:quinol monooxygenase YgiN